MPEKEFNDNSTYSENISIGDFLKSYGIDSFTHELIPQGSTNRSFLVKTKTKSFVLRIYTFKNKNSKESKIEQEISFQRYLSGNNIPVPIIYKNKSGSSLSRITFNGKERLALLMNFVGGETNIVNPQKSLICELATMHAQMHILGIEYANNLVMLPEEWKTLQSTAMQKLQVNNIENKGTREFVLRGKKYESRSSSDLPHGLNHMDLDLDGNVIVSENKVTAIIDFDSLEFSPCVVCLGYSLWRLLCTEGEEMMSYYLSAYEEVRPLNDAERSTLQDVLFFRNYSIAGGRLLVNSKETSLDRILVIEKHISELCFN